MLLLPRVKSLRDTVNTHTNPGLSLGALLNDCFITFYFFMVWAFRRFVTIKRRLLIVPPQECYPIAICG